MTIIDGLINENRSSDHKWLQIHVVGSLNNYDGDGNENVISKYNFSFS